MSKLSECVEARDTENTLPLLASAPERTLGSVEPGLGAGLEWGLWPRAGGKQELGTPRMEDKVEVSMRTGGSGVREECSLQVLEHPGHRRDRNPLTAETHTAPEKL